MTALPLLSFGRSSNDNFLVESVVEDAMLSSSAFFMVIE